MGNASPMLEALLDARNELVDTDAEASHTAQILARWAICVRSALRALGRSGNQDKEVFQKAYGEVMLKFSGLEEAINLVDTNLHARSSEVMVAIDGAIDEHAKLSTECHSIADPAVRQQVFALTGGKCAYCGIELKDGGGEQDQFCIEHVVPSSKGGPNHLANYVPSCRSCNNSKGDRHVLYFIQNSHVLRYRAPVPVSPILEAAE